MQQSGGATRRERWYYGWNIVAACVLSTILVNGIPTFAFSLFLKDWTAELHSRISFLQLGVSAMGVVCALLAPAVGVMSDKYSARLVFGIGLVAVTLTCFAMSFVTAAWQIVAIYALLLPVAIDCGALIPANAVISRWFVRRLGLAMGLTAFGVALAGMIGPPIVAGLLPSLGWRMIWRLTGLVTGLVFTPIVLFVLRDRPTEREGLHYLTGENAARSHHGHGAGTGLKLLDVFRRRNFWLLVIVALPMIGAYIASLQNFAPIAAARGFGQQTAGILLSVFSVSHLIASLLAGLLSDRFGNRLPLSGLALLTAVGCVFIGFSASMLTLSLGVVLVGLSGGIWPLLGAATAVEFGSEGFGRAFGTLSLFLPVASVAAFIVARVQESTGSYAPAFSAVAAIILFGGGICLFMHERRGPTATMEQATIELNPLG
jgi:MFS family permease